MSPDPGTVITLHPGDVALGRRGDRLETLLGSCVAIILTDARRTIGAMCHFIHAKAGAQAERASTACGPSALAAMDELLAGCGLHARLCSAYVYGGGNMFPQIPESPDVGRSNARWALDALGAMGVPILATDVGGTAYRQLRWTVGPDAPTVVAVPV